MLIAGRVTEVVKGEPGLTASRVCVPPTRVMVLVPPLREVNLVRPIRNF